MADKTYTFYNDPGHGWLEVTVVELEQLGIDDKISQFSYREGNHAYLEEDCDAPKFLAAYREKHGMGPPIQEAYTNKESFIRRMQPFYRGR